MNLEDRIKIAEWCGWNCPDPKYFGGSFGTCHREHLFTEASHFEALRQVLRERRIYFQVRYWNDEEWIELYPEDNTTSIIQKSIGTIRVQVINGDEHTAWLEAVSQLIQKESA